MEKPTRSAKLNLSSSSGNSDLLALGLLEEAPGNDKSFDASASRHMASARLLGQGSRYRSTVAVVRRPGTLAM